MNDDTYIHVGSDVAPLEDAFCVALGKALRAIVGMTDFNNLTERDWDALRAYAESRLREIDGPEF